MGTKRFRSVALILGPIVVASYVVRPAEAQRTKTEKEQNVEHELTPDLGPVQKARSWVGKQVHSTEGKPLGTIDDLVLDLDTARVVLFLVAPRSQPDSERRVAVPAMLILKGKDQNGGQFSEIKFRLAPTIGTGDNARPLTRQLARPPFEHFQVEPPWSGLNQDLSDDDVFVYLSSLEREAVEEPDGTKLGYIEDFAIAIPSGRIGYAALAHSHGSAEKKLYPIPLGVFVVLPDRDVWLLELPDKLLDATPEISGADWPTEIGRGWVEYVHVRYGGGAMTGVQRATRASQAEAGGPSTR